MTPKRGDRALENACRRKQVHRILECYLRSCREETADETTDRGRSRKNRDRFPNLAGFCRYLKIGTRELEALRREFPDETEEIFLTLEDEALNSGLPPALLSAYLKKRLGYEKELAAADEPSTVVRFEHDIFEDGE
jgi:hypothetical protein